MVGAVAGCGLLGLVVMGGGGGDLKVWSMRFQAHDLDRDGSCISIDCILCLV